MQQDYVHGELKSVENGEDTNIEQHFTTEEQ